MSNDGKQDRAAGKLKKTAGNVTGDDQMKSEGQTQEAKGGAKEKLDDVKDSVKGAVSGATGKDDSTGKGDQER